MSESDILAGVKVRVKVSASQTYNFYVINDSGEELTLIMDKNLGNKVAWYESAANNSYGPITALNYLNSQTSDWANIPAIKNYVYNNNLNGNTNTFGYQKLEITDGIGKLTSQDGATITSLVGTMNARLFTYEEAETLKISNSNSLPSWLYENLGADNTELVPVGYWLLTSTFEVATDSHKIDYNGNLSYNSSRANSYGIRPVITLSK